MKAKMGCAMLLCLMGYGTGAIASGNMAGSIESDPIDSCAIYPGTGNPFVLAQAATSGDGTQQPDYLLTLCKQTESTGDPRSAFRAVDPAGMLSIYLQNRDHRVIDLATRASIKPILMEGTTHGKIVTFSNIANYGGTAFRYDPIPNYVGNDKAVFLAEFEGKRYKIVINLVVTLTVGESPLMEGEEPVCPPPKLIKVNGKPVSGALDFGPGYNSMGADSIDWRLITLHSAAIP